jgi:hypothetical protein
MGWRRIDDWTVVDESGTQHWAPSAEAAGAAAGTAPQRMADYLGQSVDMTKAEPIADARSLPSADWVNSLGVDPPQSATDRPPYEPDPTASRTPDYPA